MVAVAVVLEYMDKEVMVLVQLAMALEVVEVLGELLVGILQVVLEDRVDYMVVVVEH